MVSEVLNWRVWRVWCCRAHGDAGGWGAHRALPYVGYVAPLGLGFVGDLNLNVFTLTGVLKLFYMVL